ncbi:MAG: alanine--tRNA ligase, partial [Actinobacteria bacterium]|nr:alanine--tRNA ligase [Actinomycetota bacterium]
LAEHARSSTMLVNDGVFPSNEGRGYVLRRIIRRAVRHAYLLGTEKLVMPALVESAISTMGEAYPDVIAQKDFILGVLTKEEERFRQTLKTGLSILENELNQADENHVVSGSTAFLLHDTYGFPLEVTQEIVAERELSVDLDGFRVEMDQQRQRAKAARRGNVADDSRIDLYREVMESHGTGAFVGYERESCLTKVLAIIPDDDGLFDVFLEQTPFYAESGGQVGDTGFLTSASGNYEVLDTTYALPGLRRHLCRVISGTLLINQEVDASIDVLRRTAIRRHHTATHILHWALREVLGEHVKQAGSLVNDERLRFDFSHYDSLTIDQLKRIEDLANTLTLDNAAVTSLETSKDEALEKGAIAFFGDKYGDQVRVLSAGPSVELCGGTHVTATGDIGLIHIISEGSVGANLRRIEAVAGIRSLELLQREQRSLNEAATLLGTSSQELLVGVHRKLDEFKAVQDENKILRSRLAVFGATSLAQGAHEGIVVARVDELSPGDLRELALAVRQQVGIRAVVLGGLTPEGGVSLVAAVTPSSGLSATALIKDAAKVVGGGGGGKGDIATAGGKLPEHLPEALRLAEVAARS